MGFLLGLSNFVIPVTILSIVLYGCLQKINLYEAFLEGAKEGLQTVVDILPTLIGLMMAVSVLRSGGALDLFIDLLRPLLVRTGFPTEVVPLCLMRLVSSSAATGLVTDLFQTFGPDSFIGRLSSVMMSCTETVFYTMSVYLMSVGIRQSRYTLAGALIANGTGMVVSYYITLALFGPI